MSTPNWAKRLHPVPARSVGQGDSTTGIALPVMEAPSDSISKVPSILDSALSPEPYPDALITAAQRIASNSTNLAWESVLSEAGCDAGVAHLALGEEHWESLLRKARARSEPVAQTTGEIVAWYLENYDQS